MLTAGNAVEMTSADALFDNLVWMTSEKAARYPRTTVGALRTAVSRGQIRARKWRRRLYFKKIELDLLLEGSRRTRRAFEKERNPMAVTSYTKSSQESWSK